MKKQAFLCPCGSKRRYQQCCQKYHEGYPPEHALCLMRSRYCAYALQLADYIISTTDRSNPSYSSDKKKWREDILQFCRSTHFERLEILEFVDGMEEATVTFRAFLKQGLNDVSFSEKSHFVKVEGKWLYKNGDYSPLK